MTPHPQPTPAADLSVDTLLWRTRSVLFVTWITTALITVVNALQGLAGSTVASGLACALFFTGWVLARRASARALRRISHAVIVVAYVAIAAAAFVEVPTRSASCFYFGLTSLLAGHLLGVSAAVAWSAVGLAATVGLYGSELLLRRSDATLAFAVTRALDPTVFLVFAGFLAASMRSTTDLHIAELVARERTIREQSVELRAAKDAADRANHAKSMFLANMSHDIRTPMHGVLGMTEILLAAGPAPEHRELVETLRASGRSLLAVINDILDFSKIEAGKLAVVPADHALRRTLDEAVQLFAEPAESKGLELTCVVCPEVPDDLRGDPDRLRQILSNLLSNAIRFTERGAITVRVTRGGTERAPRLRIAVVDTGVGIPAAASARMFRPFEQVDASASRREGGTGLGLAISQRLAALMGGAVEMSSAEGVGSTFTLDLPCEPASVVRATERPLAGRRVGVVAGSAAQRELIASVAGRAGARLDDAADGAPGDFDAVVVDLPDGLAEGLALARAVRSRVGTARVVALAPIRLLVSPEQLRGAGVDALVRKPAGGAKLVEALAGGAPAEAPTADPLHNSLAGRRLLLAEDNPVNRRIALAFLARLGASVDVAENGAEVLSLLGRAGATYDAILMDCQMPEMDGFEATRRIRRSEAGGGRRVPIIALTASALETDGRQCFEAGMDLHLPKPYSIADLTRALSHWRLTR